MLDQQEAAGWPGSHDQRKSGKQDVDGRSDGNKQGWRRTLFNESYLF